MLGQVMLQIGESASLSVTRPSRFFGTLLRKPSPGTHHPQGVGNWLAKNQRFFSFFETFTNGRLTQKTRLKGQKGRTYLPLYLVPRN